VADPKPEPGICPDVSTWCAEGCGAGPRGRQILGGDCGRLRRRAAAYQNELDGELGGGPFGRAIGGEPPPGFAGPSNPQYLGHLDGRPIYAVRSVGCRPRARAPGEGSSPMPDPLSPEEAAQELEQRTRAMGAAIGELVEGAERPTPSPAALERLAELPRPLHASPEVEADPYGDLEPAEAWAIEGVLRQLGPQELRQRTRLAERCARDVLRGEAIAESHARRLLEDREAAIAELRAVLAGGGHLWQVEALVRDRLAPFVADAELEEG
jgi:hypothetical protein